MLAVADRSIKRARRPPADRECSFGATKEALLLQPRRTEQMRLQMTSAPSRPARDREAEGINRRFYELSVERDVQCPAFGRPMGEHINLTGDAFVF